MGKEIPGISGRNGDLHTYLGQQVEISGLCIYRVEEVFQLFS